MRITNQTSRKWTRSLEWKFERQDVVLRRKYRDHLLESIELQKLAEATGIQEQELLARLRCFGLSSDTFGALSLLPIAVAAWASGQVTSEEQLAAMQAIEESEIRENQAAIDVYRSWLCKRPAPGLWQLWHDFTVSRKRLWEPEKLREQGDILCGAATKVAEASGGILGWGAICAAEERVLEGIRAVHAI